jgi:hypothetical protein
LSLANRNAKTWGKPWLPAHACPLDIPDDLFDVHRQDLRRTQNAHITPASSRYSRTGPLQLVEGLVPLSIL